MTTRHPSSCLQAVSRLKRTQHGRQSTTTIHIAFTTTILQQSRPYSFSKTSSRSKSTGKSPPPPSFSLNPRALPKTSSASFAALNPPETTLPPPLALPIKKPQDNSAIHLFRIGRAYGTFYKDGLKNVWRNHKAASALKKRVVADLNARKPDLASPASAGSRWAAFRDEAVQRGVVNRADFQQLERNARDIGKLPFFGLLVLLFGEWLPLLVPFIPNRVPGTCRIPKQVDGMREKSEKRRRWAFRAGDVPEPDAGQLSVQDGGKWRMTDRANVREVMKGLDPRQLMHLSCVLNQHGALWDRLQVTPPAGLLRRAVCARVQYLALDDFLLVEAGGPAGLKSEEVVIACEERGIDVLGKPEEKLRSELQTWVQKQKKDDGRGWAMMEMLFKR